MVSAVHGRWMGLLQRKISTATDAKEFFPSHKFARSFEKEGKFYSVSSELFEDAQRASDCKPDGILK